jgi:hypothetical protein
VLSRPRLWLFLCGASPLVLLVGRLLPAEGVGLALRLAGAAACVLILPGALFVRVVGTPRSVGAALAAALAWSLVLVFLVFAVLFAVSGTLGLGVGLLGGTMAAAFVLSLRAAAPAFGGDDLRAALGLSAVGAGLGAVLWWSTETIGGSLGPTVSDALFHLARIRKLDEAGPLTSIGVVNDLAGAHVHPGYAFPLWHGALALVARLADVDPELVVLYLPAILVPLALLLAYGAGAAIFRSWAGGVATAAGQLALFAFARDGVGWLQFLAQPGGAARLLLIPGALALAFTYLEERSRGVLATLAASAFVLAVVHPTYVVFVVLPLTGFLFARAIMSDAPEIRAILAGLAAIVVPAGLFLAWLAQFAGDTGTRPPVRFTLQVEAVEAGLRLRPEQLAFGGGIKVAAFVAVPLALLAARRRWAAYVLGGTAVLSVVALVPPVFERFADVISLSQAVRLAGFLPLPFALAGAAVLAARFGIVGAVASLTAAAAFELAYGSAATGAGWAVWLAALGSTCGLAAFGLLPRPALDPRSVPRWTAITAVALTLPVATAGLGRFERWNTPDPFGLTPGLVRALDQDVSPLAVVLAPSVTSYRLAGAAPVRVVVVPPGHVAFNSGEDYRARSRAVHRFFLEPAVSPVDRVDTLRRYSVDWVIVDKSRARPTLPLVLQLVYEDRRYALYRVEQEAA